MAMPAAMQHVAMPILQALKVFLVLVLFLFFFLVKGKCKALQPAAMPHGRQVPVAVHGGRWGVPGSANYQACLEGETAAAGA